MGLDKEEFHLSQDIPVAYNIFHSKKNCSDMAGTQVNRMIHFLHEKTGDNGDEEIARRMNPVSYLLFEEFSDSFDKTLYHLEKEYLQQHGELPH